MFKGDKMLTSILYHKMGEGPYVFMSIGSGNDLTPMDRVFVE